MKEKDTGIINTSEPSISIFNCREIMMTWVDIADCCAAAGRKESRLKNINGLFKVLKSMIICSAIAGTEAEKKINLAKELASAGKAEDFEKIKALIKEALDYTSQ